MSGGADNARRAYRLGTEALARQLDHPRGNRGPLVERADSTADLGRSCDRGMRHLGGLATSSVVVFPQLAKSLSEKANERITVSITSMKGGPTS